MTAGYDSEWAIGDLARLTGVSSRTLRHYQDEGILHPSRTGSGGVRFYDASGLLRLQRILILRELGLGLVAIREALGDERAAADALRDHLASLQREHRRRARQIAAVEHTIDAMEKREELMADRMFDGFDHEQHEAEVTERWGAEAYRTGDSWWRGMTTDERSAWRTTSEALAADWQAAQDEGVLPTSDRAQDLAARHVAWLVSIPGTPRLGDRLDPDYLAGLADMYVDDERFAANYGGTAGAAFVRDSLRQYVGTGDRAAHPGG